MPEKKIIAVIGATGAQGGGLVRAIHADREGPFVARAITRKLDSEKARRSPSWASRSWPATPTIRRAWSARSPAPTACSASPTSGSTSRPSARAPRPRRWPGPPGRPASSTSSGRRSRTRASGCRSTTSDCRRCRASTRCRTSIPRARWITSSPRRPRPPRTCWPRSTGRTSSISEWVRARATDGDAHARAAARRREAARHRGRGHRQVRLRAVPARQRHGRAAVRRRGRGAVRPRDGGEDGTRARTQGRLRRRAVRRLSRPRLPRRGRSRQHVPVPGHPRRRVPPQPRPGASRARSIRNCFRSTAGSPPTSDAFPSDDDLARGHRRSATGGNHEARRTAAPASRCSHSQSPSTLPPPMSRAPGTRRSSSATRARRS